MTPELLETNWVREPFNSSTSSCHEERRTGPYDVGKMISRNHATPLAELVETVRNFSQRHSFLFRPVTSCNKVALHLDHPQWTHQLICLGKPSLVALYAVCRVPLPRSYHFHHASDPLLHTTGNTWVEGLWPGPLTFAAHRREDPPVMLDREVYSILQWPQIEASVETHRLWWKEY